MKLSFETNNHFWTSQLRSMYKGPEYVPDWIVEPPSLASLLPPPALLLLGPVVFAEEKNRCCDVLSMVVLSK